MAPAAPPTALPLGGGIAIEAHRAWALPTDPVADAAQISGERHATPEGSAALLEEAACCDSVRAKIGARRRLHTPPW